MRKPDAESSANEGAAAAIANDNTANHNMAMARILMVSSFPLA